MGVPAVEVGGGVDLVQCDTLPDSLQIFIVRGKKGLVQLVEKGVDALSALGGFLEDGDLKVDLQLIALGVQGRALDMGLGVQLRGGLVGQRRRRRIREGRSGGTGYGKQGGQEQ